MSSIAIQLEKFKRNFITKIILFIFSLVLLSIISYLLIKLYEEPVFDLDIIVLRSLLIYLLVPTLIFVSTLTALTVIEYKNYFKELNFGLQMYYMQYNLARYFYLIL